MAASHTSASFQLSREKCLAGWSDSVQRGIDQGWARWVDLRLFSDGEARLLRLAYQRRAAERAAAPDAELVDLLLKPVRAARVLRGRRVEAFAAL